MMHASYFSHALSLAKNRRGFCAPNPSVGAVIVSRDGRVLAEGFHQGPGFPHAEVDALKKLTVIPDDASIYVTLEPCCHFGRTPPCTDAIIASGIKKIYYAFKDPNPIVAGKGEEKLRAANLSCEYIDIPEITEFYKSYAHWHQTKLPFITAKIATTLDGKISEKNGAPHKITGNEINNFTHQQRKQHDAILTTAKTIIADDPQLNVRIEKETFSKPLYILDRELKLPLTAKIFSTAKSVTVFHAKNINAEKFSKNNIRCIPISEENSKLNLNEVIQKIGEDGIHDLWIEAGGECFSSFLESNLLNRAFIYIAPKLLGDGLPAFCSNKVLSSQSKIHFEKLGDDVIASIYFFN